MLLPFCLSRCRFLLLLFFFERERALRSSSLLFLRLTLSRRDRRFRVEALLILICARFCFFFAFDEAVVNLCPDSFRLQLGLSPPYLPEMLCRPLPVPVHR